MTPGTRRLIFVLILAGIPLGAFVWVFRPANQYIAEQQASLEGKAVKLDQLRRASQEIEDMDAEVQKISQAVAFFEDKLPKEHEVHTVLAQVARIAEKNRLQTKLFKTEKTKPFAEYTEQPIKMRVCGAFDDYYRFLLEFERMARITKITDMKLTANTSESGLINADFSLSIFVDKSSDMQAAEPGAS